MDINQILRQRNAFQATIAEFNAARERDAALALKLRKDQELIDARFEQERVDRERRSAELLARIDAEAQACIAATRALSAQVHESNRQLDSARAENAETRTLLVDAVNGMIDSKHQKVLTAISSAANYVDQCAIEIHPNYVHAVQHAVIQCNELVLRVKEKVDQSRAVPRTSFLETHLAAAVAAGAQRDYYLPVTTSELSSGIYAIRARRGSIHFFPTSYPHAKAMVLVQADTEEFGVVQSQRFKLESETPHRFDISVGGEQKAYTCPLYRIVQI